MKLMKSHNCCYLFFTPIKSRKKIMKKKSKSIREYTRKERVRKIRNTLVQTSSELEALKINFNNCREKADMS
jgi:hypothetical protein